MTAPDGRFPQDRDAYAALHGSERFHTLLWRKILGRVQRAVPFAGLRLSCLRWLGVEVGIAPGERAPWIGAEVYVDDTFPELVRIEAGAVIGLRASLICHDDATRRVAPICLGRGSYVGAGAIVLPGVTVGAGAIVGAGAVVTKDVPPGETWGGVPARPLARRSADPLLADRTRDANPSTFGVEGRQPALGSAAESRQIDGVHEGVAGNGRDERAGRFEEPTHEESRRDGEGGPRP